MRVSYLELYNEDVRDLLSKTITNKLDVRERSDIGVYVKDLSSFVVKNADEMDKLMSIGNKNSELFLLHAVRVLLFNKLHYCSDMTAISATNIVLLSECNILCIFNFLLIRIICSNRYE